jgi:dTDP-4-amino-4,6-dideoxygalactose transaminase
LDKVEFYKHAINERDIREANRVLRSTFLTTGPKVMEFENKFSNYLNLPFTVGLMSCTAALHLSLVRQGIGPGDEVITTPLTYVATATAIIETGATPVFADVDLNSGLLDPEKARAAITQRTRAILPVHLYGRMVDMRLFRTIANEHNLKLIEDAAHCIEGKRDGIRPGQLSEAACFSFYATKNLTCGEGGAIACHTKEEADWYKSARNHGISKEAFNRYQGRYQHWDMKMMGWKCNMSDIQAGLLIHQIDRIDTNRERREYLEKMYRNILGNITGLEFVEDCNRGEKSAHHLFTILTPKDQSRDEILSKLQNEGIGCAVNYRSCHILSFFKEKLGYDTTSFPNAYEIGERTITLPLYSKMTEADIEAVCKALKKAISR